MVPVTNSLAPPICPFDVVGGDVTFSSPVPPSPIPDPANAQFIVTAAAEKHLQEYERRKLRRPGARDKTTKVWLTGDEIMGEILHANAVAMPWVIGPHGDFGPMFRNFLFGHAPHTLLTFQDTHPNATAMYQRASTFPCPLGIVHTASANWKRCSDRKFFGHSYTAPTPVEYTLQQLGLGVVKALSIHHSHALGKFGTKPPPKPRRTAVATPSPPRFLPHLDLPNPVIVF